MAWSRMSDSTTDGGCAWNDRFDRLQARATELEGRHQHRQAWLAAHAATNPDPLAAAINTLECARYVLGPHAADFLDLARERIGSG
jgi:hypothetical protein